MSNPIGHTFMYNIVILFIVIIFAFLSGTMSYYKAFKVNNRIVYAIEKFEGYNEKSKEEIDKILSTLGYDRDTRNLNCATEYKNMTLVSGSYPDYRLCIYIDDNITTGNHGSGTYYVYGVKTYMSIDLPLVNWIRIPIFTKTNQIYKFTKTTPPIY
jgi:hypothetical protein